MRRPRPTVFVRTEDHRTVLDLVPPEIFAQLAPDLFKHLNRCLASPHFKVSQRALYIWNNESLFGLIAQNRRTILPIIAACGILAIDAARVCVPNDASYWASKLLNCS